MIKLLSVISKSNFKADLGLNPSNDGTVIRIAFPALTEERRRDLVKVVKNMLKKQKLLFVTYVDGNDDLKKLEKLARLQKTI